MAVTVTQPASTAVESLNAGNMRVTVRDIQFDNNYPTGGEPVTPEQLGLQQVFLAIPTVKTAGTGSVTSLHFDSDNMKLVANAAAAEVANAVDLSAVHARVIAFGK
jgi:hypothetical protein